MESTELWRESLTLETIFPLVILQSNLFKRILSINVTELLWTRVGLSIVYHCLCLSNLESIVLNYAACRNSADYIQRHPATVFCKISVGRSKYCLEFSMTWGGLKNSRSAFHSFTIFETYLINSLRFSEV